MGERIWLLPDEGQFYKANLHCHTTLSDGKRTPEEIKELYKQQGYSVVAYTDHRLYQWHHQLMDETFIPLAAYEVNINGTVPEGTDISRRKTYHINLYDTDPGKGCRKKEASILPEHRYGDMAYINDYLVNMRKMGFFACYNHPYWSMQTIEDYGGLREVWAMEIYNYGCELDGMYGYNPQSYDEMLRAGTRLFCVATDDNHNPVPLKDPFSDSFGGFTMIKAKELTYESVIAALLQGDFYASMGPKIRELYVEGNRLVVRTSPAEKIFVMTEGRQCHRMIAKPGELLTGAEFELVGKEGYIRVDVRDEKGRHANSNAYFLENGRPEARRYRMEDGTFAGTGRAGDKKRGRREKRNMVRVQTDYFELEQICRSGQCFRMRRLEDEPAAGYEIVAGERYLRAVQEGKECRFFCSQEEFDQFWRGYFDLDEDYSRFVRQINPRDAYLTEAAASGSGIRILRQDLWEMTVSFLISQQNNIPRIRRCIENLCREYGERRVSAEGREYWGFPRPQALAVLEEDGLKACNLGYRSKYVVRTAKSVASGELDLEQVKSMPYKQAREELLKVFGAGEKVADCICLFALHHLEAFPVDTHIRQALEIHYKRGFPKGRYREIQGVIQQYMFYYELHGDKGCPAL